MVDYARDLPQSNVDDIAIKGIKINSAIEQFINRVDTLEKSKGGSKSQTDLNQSTKN